MVRIKVQFMWIDLESFIRGIGECLKCVGLI